MVIHLKFIYNESPVCYFILHLVPSQSLNQISFLANHATFVSMIIEVTLNLFIWSGPCIYYISVFLML